MTGSKPLFSKIFLFGVIGSPENDNRHTIIYRLPPLPPTLPALDELMRCWLQGVVDVFLSAFFVDVDPAFLTFLKQPGSLFGALWDHFGRLWLLVATFQAHLTPESRRLAHFAKNDSKMGAFLGPF